MENNQPQPQPQPANGQQQNQQEKRTYASIWLIVCTCFTLTLELLVLGTGVANKFHYVCAGFSPAASVLVGYLIFKGYTRRGRDKGELQNVGFYYFFINNGRKIWHCPTVIEIIKSLFTITHVAASTFDFLRICVGWKIVKCFTYAPLAYATGVFLAVLVDYLYGRCS